MKLDQAVTLVAMEEAIQEDADRTKFVARREVEAIRQDARALAVAHALKVAAEREAGWRLVFPEKIVTAMLTAVRYI